MLAGGARRSDRLSSIGLTGLPWSSRKKYGGLSGLLGRTVRNEGISAHRTVRYHLADCPLHNMSTQFSFRWFCVFFLNDRRNVRVSLPDCPQNTF